MPDSELFAISLSRNGGKVFFSVSTGHVSIAPFGGFEGVAEDGNHYTAEEWKFKCMMEDETVALPLVEVYA